MNCCCSRSRDRQRTERSRDEKTCWVGGEGLKGSGQKILVVKKKDGISGGLSKKQKARLRRKLPAYLRSAHSVVVLQVSNCTE